MILVDLIVKGTTGHTLKLEKAGCIAETRKYFFSPRVVA